MQCLRIHGHVSRAVIGDIVLRLGHDTAVLYALDQRRADLTAQQRVLAQRVVGAEEARIALDIDERLQHHIDTQCARIARNERTIVACVLATERGSQAHGGGQCGRRKARQHSGRTVGKTHGPDPQSRYARQIPGLSLVGGCGLRRAVQHLDLLLERHAREQRIDARSVRLLRHDRPAGHREAQSRERSKGHAGAGHAGGLEPVGDHAFKTTTA